MALTDVEITISGARDLKNVNWKHGDLCAYAVAWIDDTPKITTRIDPSGDTNPSWGQKFTLSVPKDKLEEARLIIEVYHDKAEDPEKAIVGRTSLPLLDVMDAGGFDEVQEYALKLKRPSGRPHGKIDIEMRLRERRGAYSTPPPPAPYGQSYYNPNQGQTRDWQANYPGYNYPAQPYNQNYPPQPYPNYPNYSAPPPYGSPTPPAYGAPPPNYYSQNTAYQQPPAPVDPSSTSKTSKFGGMGTGLAVSALAGAVGGLALGEYIQHEENEAAEDQAEEDAERYEAARDDDYGGGDDYSYGDDY